MNHIDVESFSSYIPRYNLPSKFTTQNHEEHFVDAFRSAYLSQQKKRGVSGKEFAFEGFGIADLIHAQLKPNSKGKATRIGPITAFEMKLKNFKKAVSQAYRYTYFADRAIAVIPLHKYPPSQETLRILKKLGVGVWMFDMSSGRIHKLITPSKTKAKLPTARKKACATIEAHLNCKPNSPGK